MSLKFRLGSAILAMVFLHSFPALAQLSLEGQRTQRKQSTSRRSAPVRQNQVEFPDLDARPLPELIESIQSFSVLLRSAKNNLREEKLMQVNRASAYLAIAQKMFKAGAHSNSEKAKSYLTLAERDALRSLIELEKTGGNRDLKSRAHFVLGLARIYSGQMSRAADAFEKAESLDPTASWVSLVNLYVAEQRFVEGRYVDSMRVYKKVLAQAEDSSHRILALYRIGWCHFNLKQVKNSMDRLQEALLEARKQESSIRRDIAGDLLHVTLRSQKADAYLRIQEGILEDEIPFQERLSSAINVFRDKRDVAGLRTLWNAFKDDSRISGSMRLEIVTSFLTASAAPFATKVYSQIFQWVNSTLEGMNFKYDPQGSEDVFLEEEVRLYIKALLDTYTRKVRSPDRVYTQAQMASDLLIALRAYQKFFSMSSYLSRIQSVYHDACIELKNVACLEEILQSKDLATEKYERIFSALWKQSEEQKNLRQVNEILEKYSSGLRSDKIRREVLLRRGELLIADKNWKGATELVEANLSEFPKELRFLQQRGYVLFEQKLYTQILEDPRFQENLSQDKVIKDLYEQSAIRQLDQKINKEENLEEAWSLFSVAQSQMEPAARKLALRDLASLLLKKEEYLDYAKHVHTHRRNLSLQDLKELSPAACRWALIFLKPKLCGELIVQLKSTKKQTGKLTEELEFYDYLSEGMSDTNKSPSLSRIMALSPEFRPVALQWRVLHDSEGFLKELLGQKKVEATLGDWALIAFRNRNNSPLDEDYLGPLYSDLARLFPAYFKMKRGNASSLMSKIEKMNFEKKKGTEREQSLAKAIQGLREIRAKISTQTEGDLIADRIRLLEALAQKEKNVANELSQSAPPSSLDDKGKEKYREEIKKVEKEFEENSTSYSVAARDLREKYQELRENTLEEIPNTPDLEDFDFPKWSRVFEKNDKLQAHFEELQKAKEFFRAWMVWDLLKVPGNLDEETFLWARSGFVLGTNSRYGTREFLYNSLLKSGEVAKKALNEWKDAQ